jgi:hypothetical protein
VLRPGDLLVLFGGLLVLGFSFAPFVEYHDQAALLFGLLDVPLWFSAWSLQTFMVPLTTFVVVAALLGIAAVAVRFALRRDPELLGFRLRQLEVGLALFGSVVLLGMVASDKHAVVGARRLAEVDPTFRPEEVAMSTGWGAVLMLVGALLALAGALLNHLGIGPTMVVGTGPAAPPAGRYQGPPGPYQNPPGPYQDPPGPYQNPPPSYPQPPAAPGPPPGAGG